MTPWVAGLLAALAVALAVPARPRLPVGGEPSEVGEPEAWVRRRRVPLALLAAVGVLTLVGGVAGAVASPVVALGTWWLASRSEPPGAARARRRAARDLPHLVLLLSAALRSGADPSRALGVVVTALPGAAADRVRPVLARLDLGVPPARVWGDLGRDDVLGPLGRTLARAAETGAPVAEAVEQLADDLAQAARAGVEDRARAVGVRAALPLGLCLLPAFLLIGIVPLVAGLLATVTG